MFRFPGLPLQARGQKQMYKTKYQLDTEVQVLPWNNSVKMMSVLLWKVANSGAAHSTLAEFPQ